MRARALNPWDPIPSKMIPHQGKAIIHVALDHSTPFGRSFSERDLVDLVHSLTAGSVVFQAGITPGQWGGVERSARVEVVNGGAWIQNSKQFEARMKGIAARLCRALQQERVLLELLSQAHGYRAMTYFDAAIQKKRSRALKAGIRGGLVRVNPARVPCFDCGAEREPEGYRKANRKGSPKEWLCSRCFRAARNRARASR